ncbi:MAG: DNA-directed DNA polymerase [Candidatus Woesearchaeota archaeon]
MKKIHFYPIDISYQLVNDISKFYIYGRTEEGEQICAIDQTFKPYFLVELKDNNMIESAKQDFLHLSIPEAQIIDVQLGEKIISNEDRKLLKVFTKLPNQIPDAAKFFQALHQVKAVYEHDIKFVTRYLIDNKIIPLVLIEVKGEYIEDKNVKSRVPCFEVNEIRQAKDEIKSLTEPKVLALDIETYNPSGKIFAPEKDPIIMLSLYGNDLKKVITYKKFKHKLDYIEFVKDEKELLQRFKELIIEYAPDIITGYNSDNFDLPYINTRARLSGVELDLGLDYSYLKTDARSEEARITGIAHIDLLNFIRRIMGRTLKSDFFTLSEVSKELLNDDKVDIEISDMFKAWEDNKGLEKYVEYNLKDSELAYRLFQKVYPNMLELIKIVGLPIFELSRTSHSQLVENYAIRQTTNHNEIIPSRPSYHEKEERSMTSYQGGSVFQPKAGLYKDIAVVDFRSFWPSLIVSHNIGPSTIDCDCCEKSKLKIEVEGRQFHFCEKHRGFVPDILKELIQKRAEVKRKLKENKKDVLLSARSQALKDLSNAFYGYLGFSSARWYDVNCSKSITAFGRKYIQEVMDKAMKKDFGIVYSDTDSVFLEMKGKTLDQVKEFVNNINKDLLENMELELDEYYPAALFVSMKSAEGGAKKRYALLTKDHELKIKGFESVRRNTSPISKEVQETILKLILADNAPKKALDYLKKEIDDLRKKKIKKERLIMTTQLQKPIEEYDSVMPHVAVAKRMVEQGYEMNPGSVIQFIITKGTGKISERARLPKETNEGDYDPEYYINNQIIPAVEKIFEALGYNLEEILTAKSQSSLSAFLK